MPLANGTRVGPYEIAGPLGVGGMGEVYRARDARLGRDVALKVLPEVFATDAERLARFEREAQVLAALKHPNIGAIYGLEEGTIEGGAHLRALVLELIEGDTLADRIARGPIPLDDALPIANHIAEALKAAHEQGVIHRDLKPANIKITPDGFVKVLDFGLAKLSETGSGIGDPGSAGAIPALSMSPTITSPAATGLGVILGTAAYMSPEQAKGRPADKRSDVWAFGCVLFEMLTGKRAFDAEDISDTLALVLKGEPSWNALPSSLPKSIRTLLRTCLEKDRRNRISDISSVLFVLEHQSDLTERVEASAAPSAPQPSSVRRRIAIVAVIALAAVTTGISVWYATRAATPVVTRFFVAPPDDAAFVTGGRPGATAAISPDGRALAFTARSPEGTEGKVMLWLRPLDALAAQPLAGTDDAQFPFWSPDGKFIAYFTSNKLMKIAATGGPPQTVCVASDGRGGSWGSAGEIVYGTNTGPLLRVPSTGGTPSPITHVTTGQINHRFPAYLPDGSHVIYYAQGSGDAAGLYVVSVETGETKRLAAADSGAVYDSGSGYLLFASQGSLLAQRFDAKQLQLTDGPLPVAEHVESAVFTGVTAFSLSTTGTLTYSIGLPSVAGVQMSWVDRSGKMVGTVGPIGGYIGLDLSPDGKRVVAHRHDGTGGDIWVADTARGTLSRLTFDPTQDYSSPIWSPDQRRVAFGISIARGNKKGLLVKSSTGVGGQELLVESDLDVQPTSWTPDGRWLIFTRQDPKTRSDLWLLPLDGERKPTPLITTPFSESNAQISPDGKWLAYQSDETGQQEIYVRPFPSGDGKWQISNGETRAGSFAPRWRGDGRELFYMDSQIPTKLMAVDIKTNGSELEIGNPSALFESGYANLNAHGGQPHHAFAVSRDGQRFLIPMTANVAQRSTSPIAVVLNWAQGIQH